MAIAKLRGNSLRFVKSLGAMALSLAPLLALSHLAHGEEPVLDQDQRQQMYRQLAKDVEAFEARHSILKTVVRLVSPTVVHIQWRAGGGFSRRSGKQREVEEAGSGVVIHTKDRFYVITNYHVVRDAELSAIEISCYGGRQLRPAQLWFDTATDIAVLAVEENDLTPAKLGNSDALEIGDFVLAVGSPFGLSHSVTYGIISAKGRRQLELGDDSLRLQDFLQTDAAINPGNSGGPLINLRGEVVGINTAIASNSGGNEGIGFSIPINMVVTVVRQLIDQGKVTRAFLGVTLDKEFDLSAASKLGLSRPRGARISQVTPGSAADLAKLRVGDVILEFNHVGIEDDDHLVTIVSLTEVGKQVPVQVLREGQELTLEATVGDRTEYEKRLPARPAGGGPPSRDDVESNELSQNTGDAWDVDVLGLTLVDPRPDGSPAGRMNREIPDGLLVTRVHDHGPAAGRIAVGDVIDQVERVPVRSIDDLERALSTANLERAVQLRVIGRQGGRKERRQVVLQPDLAAVIDDTTLK